MTSWPKVSWIQSKIQGDSNFAILGKTESDAEDQEEEVDLATVDYMALMKAEQAKQSATDKKQQVEPHIENEESIDEADVDEANLQMANNKND